MSPRVVFDGVGHDRDGTETVLEALERHGVPVTSSCRAGNCHSCLLRAREGDPGPAARRGLKDTLGHAGYFLACQARPAGDLVVDAPGDDLAVPAVVRGLRMLGERTLEVRLRTDPPLAYRPGQFVTLVRGTGDGDGDGGSGGAAPVARSYSLAGLPDDGDLCLHVRHYPGGAMSGWLAERARPGDRLTVRGPYGECFYVPGRPDQPLLLAGTGTGLAPLYGIARDALRHGHTGPIHLVHGAVDARGLYLVEELAALAAAAAGLRYDRCVLRDPADAATLVGPLGDVVAALVPDPAGHRVFLCGDPELTRALRRAMFLAGASHRDIHVDAFTPSAAPPPRPPALPRPRDPDESEVSDHAT